MRMIRIIDFTDLRGADLREADLREVKGTFTLNYGVKLKVV